MAVLITCHNRVKATLSALSALERAAQEVQHDIYLVDDGSTDGTGEAVQREFPYVNIIQGDGKLYWARGMRLAWETAAKSADYDFYLWLNDDLELKPNAIMDMLSDYETCNKSHAPNQPLVVVGVCSEDAAETLCSYGVKNSNDELMPPNGKPQKANGWFNGNCVLVPREVYGAVGMISGEYTHARADYDYAERLKLANVLFYGSSRYVGVCHDDFCEKMRPLTFPQRISLLWRPGYWNLKDLWRIRSRYHGVPKAMLSCAHLVAIVFKGVK